MKTLKKKSPRLGEINLQRVPLLKMNPAAYNPRDTLRPGDPEYAKLEASLAAFGYVEPIVWNKKTGNLVGGHQRYTVLKAKGAKHADVSVVDLELPKEKALNLALNKIKGRWRADKLSDLLEELQRDESEGGIDTAVTGFSDSEIEAICKEGDSLMEVLVPKEEDEGDEEEETGGGGKRPPPELVVVCQNRKQRKNVLKRLSREGFECRVR